MYAPSLRPFSMPPPVPVLVLVEALHLRETLAELLAAEGYAAHAAPSSEVALQHLARLSTPCVVLLDLLAPGASGWALLETVRARGLADRLKLVAVTTGPTPPELHSQVSAVLTLPFGLEALLAAVAHASAPGEV